MFTFTPAATTHSSAPAWLQSIQESKATSDNVNKNTYTTSVRVDSNENKGYDISSDSSQSNNHYPKQYFLKQNDIHKTNETKISDYENTVSLNELDMNKRFEQLYTALLGKVPASTITNVGYNTTSGYGSYDIHRSDNDKRWLTSYGTNVTGSEQVKDIPSRPLTNITNTLDTRKKQPDKLLISINKYKSRASIRSTPSEDSRHGINKKPYVVYQDKKYSIKEPVVEVQLSATDDKNSENVLNYPIISSIPKKYGKEYPPVLHTTRDKDMKLFSKQHPAKLSMISRTTSNPPRYPSSALRGDQTSSNAQLVDIDMHNNDLHDGLIGSVDYTHNHEPTSFTQQEYESNKFVPVEVDVDNLPKVGQVIEPHLQSLSKYTLRANTADVLPEYFDTSSTSSSTGSSEFEALDRTINIDDNRYNEKIYHSKDILNAYGAVYTSLELTQGFEMFTNRYSDNFSIDYNDILGGIQAILQIFSPIAGFTYNKYTITGTVQTEVETALKILVLTAIKKRHLVQ